MGGAGWNGFMDGWSSCKDGWMDEQMDGYNADSWRTPVDLCWLLKYLYWFVNTHRL